MYGKEWDKTECLIKDNREHRPRQYEEVHGYWNTREMRRTDTDGHGKKKVGIVWVC